MFLESEKAQYLKFHMPYQSNCLKTVFMFVCKTKWEIHM